MLISKFLILLFQCQIWKSCLLRVLRIALLRWKTRPEERCKLLDEWFEGKLKNWAFLKNQLFQITYDNHKDFGKSGKSPVRIFTNLPKSTIQLSSMEDYRWVENLN